ncbi:MAG: hypothetical protein ACD_75C00697G0005 [uncultured bacterium]|nr:MAG: hypothetical protein ACD_75C00697G0005 [uncultured bacterium]
MMKYHNLDFPGAVKELAKRYHIELPERPQSREEEERSKKRELLFAINEKCATLYSQYLQQAPGADIARAYLRKRGVGADLQARFRIGYAPPVEAAGWNFLGSQFKGPEQKNAVLAGLLVEKENGGCYDRFRDRILFPIMDISGRVCGFGGRIVGEGQPKYLNSPESEVFSKSRLLLGLYQQKEVIRRQNEAILVEGNFDLISLVEHGCANVAAPLGTALTREQLRLVKRFAEKVTLLFDGDNAGVKAAERAVPLFLAEQIPGRVAFLPDGHDPDTFVREKGVAELNRLLGQAVSLPEFALNRMIREHGLTLDGKSKIVEELRPLISAAASPLQRSVFISHFAEKLGMAAAQLDAHLGTPARSMPVVREAAPRKVQDERPVPLSMAQRQLVEFMILQPRFFSRLEEAGLRQCLAGGLGEILFLQQKSLLEGNPDAEPEELLTVLPEGAERNLVADLLLRPPVCSSDGDEERPKEELADLLLYLRRFHLKKNGDELLQRMQHAERDGNATLLQELMLEQVAIHRKLHDQQG